MQDYALKIHKYLPSYRTILSGPLHAPLFKSTVTIDGRTFESPQDYGRKKEAESAAARVAFLSLTQEAKLSEQMLLVQAMQYTSSDNLNQGEYFQGGPSKKQKQMHVAELDFQHSKNNSRSVGSGIHLPVADETQPLGEVENDKSAAPEQSMMAEIKDLVKKLLPLVSALPTNTSNLAATTSTGPSTEAAAAAAAATPVARARRGCSKPTVQVQVYRRHPELALPEGATVLPFSNDEWVAVSLPPPQP